MISLIKTLLRCLVYLKAIHLQNHLIFKQNQTLIMNQQELASALEAVSAQVAKIGTESSATLQKVTDLEAAIQNAGQVSPEVQTAFDALKAQVQVVDDLIPDAPVPQG